MSTTSTRFLLTSVWLAAVFTALTMGFPHLRVAPHELRIDPPANPLLSTLPVRPWAQSVEELVSRRAELDGAGRTGTPATPGDVTSGVRRTRSEATFAAMAPGSNRTGIEATPGNLPSGVIRTGTDPVVPGQSVADRLVSEAQTAADAGRHAAAADALRRLATERPLTLDESRWLAGQHDAAGDDTHALVAYYALVDRIGNDPAIWERIGDLELQNGRPRSAAFAYARVEPGHRTPGVWVKTARAAAASGETDAAVAAYRSALDGAPADADVITLEAARYAASINRPAIALAFYGRQTTAAQARPGMQLEMARAALAANRPAEALHFTSAARATGADSVELRYAHAQALHMTGQPGAAATMFRALQAERPGDPRFIAWQARTAQAEGRHLDAYELFSESLHMRTSPDVLVDRGDVSAARGDRARARADYERAQAAGADEQVVRERLGRVESTPVLSLPFEYLRDSNGIELVAQTARADVWTTGPFRLAARWVSGRVRQQATSLATRAAAVDLDDWWVTPRLSIAGSAGFSRVASQTRPAWDATARYAWTDGGSLAVRSSRKTPWSGDPSRELMRFNRISDLAGVGAAFDAVSFGAGLDVPVGPGRGVRADLTTREYSDGNASRDLFLQFQQVVANGSTWVAVQPHVYVERWQQTNAAYYSPDQHVTTGVTLRAVGRQGIWTFDTAITPQLLTSSGRTGVGASIVGGLRAQIGGASVGGSAMFFDDRRYQYDLRRVVADVRIPIGR